MLRLSKVPEAESRIERCRNHSSVEFGPLRARPLRPG